MNAARSRRLLGVGAVAAVLLMLSAGTAAAAPPDIERFPGGTETLMHSECPFPVREDAVSRQGVAQTFVDQSGETRTVHVAGSFTAVLTHVLPDGSDGASVRVNFSGPGTIDPVTGDLSGSGPWLLGSPDDPATPEFDGFLRLVQGRVSLSIDPVTSVLTVHSTTGRVTDLCATLA